MENNYLIKAVPVRIIPFDLGRQLTDKDADDIKKHIKDKYETKEITARQNSILKGCINKFNVNDHLTIFIYINGIAVVVIKDKIIEYQSNYDSFAISYGENRQNSHKQLFGWTHSDSAAIRTAISELQKIVRSNSKKHYLRASASKEFENKGLSYIMTLSMFDINPELLNSDSFENYPDWMQRNLCALLDPSSLYLEDSNKFEALNENGLDLTRILEEIKIKENLKDYERHKHVNVFMSWAAVVVLGQLQKTDLEEYTTLEVQLQSDWFYVYCLEKNLNIKNEPSKRDIIDFQRQNYELDELNNRLYDFDDSSIPSRILDIQKGLVETSGLNDNINHLQRKIKYILDREQLNVELKQKRLGQSTEILLFIIAFIQIAPIVAEYGNKIFPYAGIIINCLIVLAGIVLLIRKN